MPGVVIQIDAAPVRPTPTAQQPITADFVACDFRCEFEELVFADDNGTGLTNDITDFLIRKISASDTVLIELLKEGIVVATIADSTYGTFYNGFDNQPLYIGWLADWTLIFNAFSGGRYQVRVTTTILGQENVFTSRIFRLNLYDDRSANRTVKIESFQNGNIESSEFDFTELLPGGWPSSIRLRGTFGQMKPTLERDIYQDPSYRAIQNRDSVRRDYTLRCEIIPETIYGRIATKDILANQVLISSFDLLQDETYEQYPVVPESFEEAEYGSLGRLNFSIIFSDRQKNIIKRNF